MQVSPSYQVKVRKKPPSFVFLGEPFTIDFTVLEEDHSHPEKLCNAQTPLHEHSSALRFPVSTDSNCIKEDVTKIDRSTTTIPSFEIAVELVPKHVVNDNSIDSRITSLNHQLPALNDSTYFNVVVPNVESRVLHIATTGQQRRQRHKSMLTLNLLQDLESVALGEIGTIQCSLTGDILPESMHNEDHIVPVQQQTSQSTTISTLVCDVSPMTCQIRIIAFCCDNDDERFDRTRSKSKSQLIVHTSNPNKSKSAVAVTSAITIVRHKILITSCNNEASSHGINSNHSSSGSGKDWNSVWYKDEGGRDKCMEIVVGVYDRQHVAVFEAIPMLLTLCYASSNQQSLKHPTLASSPHLPIPVTNQDILNVLSPKSNELFVLDCATGTMKIRFRVEDVSKNHQGQDFCLQIAAAPDNGVYHYLKNYDPTMIAPAVSLSVNVRSKRNKRQRQFTTSSTDIAMPSSDVSSEHVYRHDSVVPTIDSSTISSSAMTESRPRLTAIQLQYALRGVVHWVQEVVTKTSFELQRQQPQNGISTQYLSSMAHSMATYHEQVHEHLNVLQYVIDFNATSSLTLSRTDPTGSNREELYGVRDNSYQHLSTTSNRSRFYEAGNFPYPQGYYHESATPTDGGNAFHHSYPYQYHNQMYYAAPYIDQHLSTTATNNKRAEPSALDGNPNGPHRHIHLTTRESEVRNFNANKGTKNTENVLQVLKRESPPHVSQMNLQASKNVPEKKLTIRDDSRHVHNVKNIEYPSDVICDTSMAANEIGADHDETRESEVEYIFAKQFKSLRTGALLGYPAYTIQKELIGFYQQLPQSIDTTKMSPHRGFDQKLQPTQPPLFTRSHLFVPIQREDFGVTELEHAKVVFDQADRSAIQVMSQCGSIEAMLHRALVYEWSQGLNNV